MHTRTLRSVVSILAAIATPLLAQAPMFSADEVTLKFGRIERGRIVERWGDGEVLLEQSSGNLRIPESKIDSVVWQIDRLREFFDRRQEVQGLGEPEVQLARWARAHGLDELARVQALWVLLRDPDNASAHEFLGHVRRGKRWRWRYGDKLVSAKTFAREFERWGRGYHLRSENWRIQTDAGLAVAVGSLLDLERLYLYWFETWGPELKLRTLRRRMDVSVRAQRRRLAGLSSARIPYYIARPFDDRCYTYVDEDTGRPASLLALGSQQILYDSLAYDNSMRSPTERSCVWVESGIGNYVENSFEGELGRIVEQDAARIDYDQVERVRKKRANFMSRLLHLDMTTLYARVSPSVPVDWAGVTLFTTYLMQGPAADRTRGQLAAYLNQSLRHAQGHGSSTFTNVFGRRIQDFHSEWRSWLELQRAAGPGR